MLKGYFGDTEVVFKVALDKQDDQLLVHQKDLAISAMATKLALEFNKKLTVVEHIRFVRGVILHFCATSVSAEYNETRKLGKFWTLEEMIDGTNKWGFN